MFVLLVGLMLPESNAAFAPINRIVGIVLVVWYLAVILPRQWQIAPELLLFMAFVIWAVGTGFLVANVPSVLWMVAQTQIQACAMACAVAGVVMYRRGIAVHWSVLVAVGMGLIAYSYATGDLQLGQSMRHAERARGVFLNPNTLGNLMVYVTFGLAGLWGARRWRFLRVLIPLLLVTTAVTIIATGSRKALVCMVAFALLWLVFVYGRQVSRRFFVVAFTAIVVLAGIYYLVDFAMHTEVMGERLEVTLSGEGISGKLGRTRADMYARGIRLFIQNPVAGVGLGHFDAQVEYGSYSHSDIVEVLCNTGFVGTMLYLMIYVVLWRRLTRIGKWSRDPSDRYQVGVQKAAILTVFCLGLGVPLFRFVYHWYVLAGLIGWSYGTERDLQARLPSAAAWARPITSRKARRS
jgi:O-antigen ligase